MNNQNSNLILAILLSIGIIGGWQYFVERPQQIAKQLHSQNHNKTLNTLAPATIAVPEQMKDREVVLQESKRVFFNNNKIAGSINLKGLRFDDLILTNYKQTIKGKPIILFSPNVNNQGYFAEIGWFSNNKNLDLPNSETLWVADTIKFDANTPVNFTWQNSEGLSFIVTVTLDTNYLFTIKQKIINNSAQTVAVQPYGLIHKAYSYVGQRMNVVHEGVSGVIGNDLKEVNYSDIKEKRRINNNVSHIDWLGINDKYWLSAFVPDHTLEYSSNFTYAVVSNEDRYQTDFVGPQQVVTAGGSFTLTHNLFSGAKDLVMLDQYEAQHKIKLFDRAVDFGWFYIITKPLLYALHFFHGIVGNFGISIMIVTVIVKLIMLGFTNKSYRSIKKMKELQPAIEHLKQTYGSDKLRFNQEIMNLYKINKVNPVAGCLPLLLQIPVFFSLYKVLNVSIEMRHAPFFGWIEDLSAPDPYSVFNLFNLLPFTPPSFLIIGIWPILMALTMFVQQRMSPPATDPVQAQVMKLMPLMFLFMFNNFPAGLLIYWTWNNILSIMQQWYVNKKYN